MLIGPTTPGGDVRYFGIPSFGQSLIGWVDAEAYEQLRYPTDFSPGGAQVATTGIRSGKPPISGYDYALVPLVVSEYANIVSAAVAAGVYKRANPAPGEWITVPMHAGQGGQAIAAGLPPGGPNSNSGVNFDHMGGLGVRQAWHYAQEMGAGEAFCVPFVVVIFGASDATNANFYAALVDAYNFWRATVTGTTVDAPAYDYTVSGDHLGDVGNIKTALHATAQVGDDGLPFAPRLLLVQSDTVDSSTTPPYLPQTGQAVRRLTDTYPGTAVCVGPRYQIERHEHFLYDASLGGWSWDSIHLSGEGGAIMGEYVAEAWQIMQDTGSFTPCSIDWSSVDHDAAGRTITFQIRSPHDTRIVWDYETVGRRRHGGFRLYDSGNSEIEITRLQILGTNGFRIDYAKPNAAALLVYGDVLGNNVASFGRYVQMAGNLRATGSFAANCAFTPSRPLYHHLMLDYGAV